MHNCVRIQKLCDEEKLFVFMRRLRFHLILENYEIKRFAQSVCLNIYN